MTPFVPSLAEASKAIAEGSLTPTALTRQALDRITALDPALHAFIEITADRALKAAATADAELKSGHSRGPLHGIPFGLKDLYDVEGIRTTAQSNVLRDNVATSNSDAYARLEAAGMVLMGKLSTHEFATGAPNHENPSPPAVSPWNKDHFAGGSSSGSGVAVSSGMLPLAMGSDTGGSIRLPAAYCGIVGLKPTYGRLSRTGVVPLSFSMDHTGPLTRTIEDCAMAMQVLAGHDPRDPGSSNVPVQDYCATLKSGVKGLRIGYARSLNAQLDIDAEETAAMDEAAAVLKSLGAELVDITLPSWDHMTAASWAIIHAESWSVHRKDIVERPLDYARITRERIMLGAFVTGPQYVQAQRLRLMLSKQVDDLLNTVDVFLAAPIASAATRLDAQEDIPLRKAQPLSVPFNLTGHPALCQPAGLAKNGLPLSLQIIGRQFDEAMVLRVAHAFEQTAGHVHNRPPEPLA